MILSAQTIRRLCNYDDRMAMVYPFSERKVHPETGTSYGLSGCSYDVRIAQDIWMYPGRFVLASTIEKLRLPLHIAGSVRDKSSLIRRGISVHNTWIDAGWSGYLTLEIKNVGFGFFKLRSGQPIAQIVFETLDEPTKQGYGGKYQDQPNRPVAAIREL